MKINRSFMTCMAALLTAGMLAAAAHSVKNVTANSSSGQVSAAGVKEASMKDDGFSEDNILLKGSNLSDLMEQVAESEVVKSYESYLPDKAFANCELFGCEDGKAYVFLNTEEFVILNDKAYEMSGGCGEAIIHYKEIKDGVKLEKVEWSADGEDHDEWIEANFPEKFLKKQQSYDAHDENGFLKLNTKMIVKAEEKLGVPVERENLLVIDPDNGTYKIVKTTESGTPEENNYTFEQKTVEEGKL